MIALRITAVFPIAFAIASIIGCGKSSMKQDGQPVEGEAKDVISLLSQLPSTHWPRDNDDVIRSSKANEWLATNVTGKRARHLSPPSDGRTVRFAGNGIRFNAIITVWSPRVQLFGKEYSVIFGNSGVAYFNPNSFHVGNLDERQAESLRDASADKSLLLSFKIDDATLKTSLGPGSGFAIQLMTSNGAVVSISE